MRHRFIVSAATLVLIAGLPAGQSQGQQPQTRPAAQPAAAAPAAAHAQTLEIDRIDLEPTGAAFSLGKPTLEGDFYVFISLPEKTTTRIRKTAVRKITPLTKDVNKETA